MVSENKLGITSSSELAKTEEKISKKKALELFETGLLDSLEAGKFKTLAFIHNYLFNEIYYFAGEIRNVNIAKGNFRFAPVMYLTPALEHIDMTPQSNFEEIIKKYVEIKELLRQALTDNISDRDVYMKGIDASYNYEGYFAFKTEDLK